MSGGFPKAKYKEVARALTKIGYRRVRVRGDHARYEREDGTRPVTILEGKPNVMISRTVWAGSKTRLGEERLERLRRHL